MFWNDNDNDHYEWPTCIDRGYSGEGQKFLRGWGGGSGRPEAHKQLDKYSFDCDIDVDDCDCGDGDGYDDDGDEEEDDDEVRWGVRSSKGSQAAG